MESPFRRLDDEKFAELMDRWLQNGGAAKLATALAKRAGFKGESGPELRNLRAGSVIVRKHA